MRSVPHAVGSDPRNGFSIEEGRFGDFSDRNHPDIPIGRIFRIPLFGPETGSFAVLSDAIQGDGLSGACDSSGRVRRAESTARCGTGGGALPAAALLRRRQSVRLCGFDGGLHACRRR